jgi:hypothetical protein
MLSSCGKQGAASPTGLNIQYEVFNLSPDLGPVDLFVNFNKVNAEGNPFTYAAPHGYFFIPTLALPFQLRTDSVSGSTLVTRTDTLQSGAKYSLFVTGQLGDNSLRQVFTVDTSLIPAIGRGKIRFVNVSPSAIGGLDILLNGTQAFTKVLYTGVSNYIEVPAGNYDFQIITSGTATALKDMPGITIQDGRLYTLYAYGYTSRVDFAAFNAAFITNR